MAVVMHLLEVERLGHERLGLERWRRRTRLSTVVVALARHLVRRVGMYGVAAGTTSGTVPRCRNAGAPGNLRVDPIHGVLRPGDVSDCASSTWASSRVNANDVTALTDGCG